MPRNKLREERSSLWIDTKTYRCHRYEVYIIKTFMLKMYTYCIVTDHTEYPL